MLEVIAPGSFITLEEDLQAQIIGVVIRPGPSVLYEVAWWNGRQRESKYLYDVEIANGSQKSQKIPISLTTLGRKTNAD